MSAKMKHLMTAMRRQIATIRLVAMTASVMLATLGMEETALVYLHAHDVGTICCKNKLHYTLLIKFFTLTRILSMHVF